MKILFFAAIAEHTGTGEITLGNVRNTDELKKILAQKYPEIENFSFAIAVNKNIIASNQDLHESDEVALLPPFSGG